MGSMHIQGAWGTHLVYQPARDPLSTSFPGSLHCNYSTLGGPLVTKHTKRTGLQTACALLLSRHAVTKNSMVFLMQN
jgi:hypothetical protein